MVTTILTPKKKSRSLDQRFFQQKLKSSFSANSTKRKADGKSRHTIEFESAENKNSFTYIPIHTEEIQKFQYKIVAIFICFFVSSTFLMLLYHRLL